MNSTGISTPSEPAHFIQPTTSKDMLRSIIGHCVSAMRELLWPLPVISILTGALLRDAIESSALGNTCPPKAPHASQPTLRYSQLVLPAKHLSALAGTRHGPDLEMHLKHGTMLHSLVGRCQDLAFPYSFTRFTGVHPHFMSPDASLLSWTHPTTSISAPNRPRF